MRWEGQAYCSILPRGHGNISPCQGKVLIFSLLWAVELRELPAPYYSEVWYHLLWVWPPGIVFQVRRMLIFQCWLLCPHHKITWEPCLVFWDRLQGYSLKWRGGHLSKLVYTLGFPLALMFPLGICLEILHTPRQSFVRMISPKKDDGVNFGCIWIQSNGEIVHVEIKSCCKSESF